MDKISNLNNKDNMPTVRGWKFFVAIDMDLPKVLVGSRSS